MTFLRQTWVLIRAWWLLPVRLHEITRLLRETNQLLREQIYRATGQRAGTLSTPPGLTPPWMGTPKTAADVSTKERREAERVQEAIAAAKRRGLPTEPALRVITKLPAPPPPMMTEPVVPTLPPPPPPAG